MNSLCIQALTILAGGSQFERGGKVAWMNRLQIWATRESPGELRKDTDFPDLTFRDSDLFKVEIKNEYFFP